MNREKFLELLENTKQEAFIFGEKYQGPGILKKIKRFLRYKNSYLKYVLGKLRIFQKYQFLSEFGVINMGLREIKTAIYFLQNIKPGDVFYDIGANQGFFSILINEAFREEVEIHAFEPIPATFKILKRNFKQNSKNIFLNNVALLDKSGYVNFKVPKNSFLSGSATFVDDFALKHLKNFYDISVKAITLDKYISNSRPPDFIKMDVEGSEKLVIKGGIQTFTKFSPVVVMEICTGELGLNFSIKSASKLVELGYKIFYIDDKTNKLIEMSLKELENFIKTKGDLNGDNFLFQK